MKDAGQDRPLPPKKGNLTEVWPGCSLLQLVWFRCVFFGWNQRKTSRINMFVSLKPKETEGAEQNHYKQRDIVAYSCVATSVKEVKHTQFNIKLMLLQLSLDTLFLGPYRHLTRYHPISPAPRAKLSAVAADGSHQIQKPSLSHRPLSRKGSHQTANLSFQRNKKRDK